MNKNIFLLISASFGVALAGCATTATSLESDKNLLSDTAHFLDIPESHVSIYNRRDDGAVITFNAKTKAGKEYKCELAVSSNLFGAIAKSGVSCDLKGQVSRNPLPKTAGK